VTTRLNLEMATSDEIIEIAREVRPDEATLVPEKRQELTTEGGLDVVANEKPVADAIRRLNEKFIVVSLFIDPDAKQIEKAKELGAQAIEIQTASYSEAKSEQQRDAELQKLRDATALAVSKGLHVHMGHGLNYT